MVLATTCWLIVGSALTRGLGWAWVAGAAGAGLLLSRNAPRAALAALLIGFSSGLVANVRDQGQLGAVLPSPLTRLEVIALTDSSPGQFGNAWALARPIALDVGNESTPWSGPNLLLDLPLDDLVVSGERYFVAGELRDRSGSAAGITYRARFRVDEIERLAGPTDPIRMAGNSIRSRVLDRLDRNRPEEALLAGFLVGDTTGLAQDDIEALRAAGISHFVAVSGSNVAGFLLLFWIVLGPLGVGTRRRGMLGLVALAVFVVATRWEPSVIRASALAGVVLGARALGWVVDRWVALAIGVGLAVLVAPALVADLGFQLSVAATGGIMLGADSLPGSLPAWLRKPLGVGLAAQLAVAPILLASFGEIPLFSPLTNLVAAPVVAISTMLAAVGVILSLDPLIELAAIGGSAFLWIGRITSWYPQLSTLPVLALATAFAISVRWPRLRTLLACLSAVALALFLWGGPGLRGPAVVFLNIGQGDAVLVATGEGRVILVDGGPGPRELWRALRRHRVRSLDLVVATHPHDDHIAGLVGLATRMPVGMVWYGGDRHQSATWDRIESELEAEGVPIAVPEVATSVALDDLRIEILGPERHYEDPNDESVVLLVDSPGPTILLTGDIENAAQADIVPPDIEVLKVPHHGGATSQISWLLATTPQVAVISVGENDFGHPHESIVTALRAAGIDVRRTDQDGDVVISLEAQT